ncbi:DUF2726 domain-containing protein [Chromohalobacter canadensis]|uniref:DUF2726 domain-containing protein n=1 Tax=Chromohalobacter canadensis TaxID=141389 RepID=UPI0021C09480|nr:DUF2726 domain-containing protein [Chromohalobacter canadensis]MCT8468418.1 DUF2726 domain-containing protein [Chromohalobacter canadensis]MCT8471473.1 DUF2726 domain-containing protein [Chromohalobacter canadensis]MCT8498926.1 DUF2726 domain-containing protein [Chromohalobacter canadensis]
MELISSLSEVLMIIAFAGATGIWSSLWLGAGKKWLKIKLSVCGVITLITVLLFFNTPFMTFVYLVKENYLISYLILSVVSYCMAVTVWEPLEWGLGKRLFDGPSNRKKNSMEDVGEELRKDWEELKKGWKSNGSGRQEPKIGDRNLSEDLMDAGQAYIAKSQLMTPSEQLAYRVIENKYKDRFFIFSQVRVVDIIKPNESYYSKGSREFNSLFRQLSQWHFDFVLCYRDDFRICCVIELDDPSHQHTARQKRDRILNRACEVAGVRLERMKINYSHKKIERA